MGETFKHKLSSGKEVELQNLDLVDLLLDGQIPDPLTRLVEIMIAQTLQARGTATIEERDAVANLLSSGDDRDDRSTTFVRFIVRRATVNPIICDDLKEARELRAQGQPVDHIAHYTRDDLYSIFFAAQGVAADFIPFLLRAIFPDESLGAVPNGDSDAASEQPAARAAGAAVGSLHDRPSDDQVGPVRGKRAVGSKRPRRQAVDAEPATG